MLDINFTFFFQVINFIVLIFLINRFLLKPAMKIIDDRRDLAEGSEEEARHLQSESDKMLVDYEQRLTEARITAAQERDKLREEGLKRENNIIRTTREETKKVIEELKVNIAEEASLTKKELNKDVDTLSQNIVEKLLGREL